MKKFLSCIVICLFIVGMFPKNIFATETGYFIVTAYYSPLPDQDYYITGSYESEKRLNGQGIAGASGKKVFSGMLAAPGKYSFGTKIELEGLGVGSVDDRGGAIVRAGKRGYEHDRIDVWVGYGDEGLRRAMYWGKRKVPGKVVSTQTQTNLDYTSIPAPSWAVPQSTKLYGKTVQVKQEGKKDNIKKLDIFGVSLGKGSNDIHVIQLQEVLKELGYYTADTITGDYDTHTIDAVYNFQINNNIVQSGHDTGAGSYGPQTRKKLNELYKFYLEEKLILEEKKEAIKLYKEESYKIAKEKIDSLGHIKYGDISPDVRELQKILRELGYFDYKDTAIFGVKTKNSLIDFQLDNKVIETIDDSGTGIFGPSTKENIANELGDTYLIKVLENEKLIDVYKALNNTPEKMIKEIEVSSNEHIFYTI